MDKSVEYLNEIYRYSQLRIIIIDDIYYKVKNKTLKKELNHFKKEYQKISDLCEKKLKKYNCKAKEISLIDKITTELYSNFNLIKNSNDKNVLKNILNKTYGSIYILVSKENELQQVSKDVKQIINKMIEVLFLSVTRQIKIINFIE